MRRFSSLFLSVVMLLMCLGALSGCKKDDAPANFDSPQTAVEALYRSMNGTSVEDFLSCYPPTIHDYVLEQMGGKEALEQRLKESKDTLEINCHTVVGPAEDEKAEAEEKCEELNTSYIVNEIPLTLEQYASVIYSLSINGQQQGQDLTQPCGMVDGKWYVLYE